MRQRGTLVVMAVVLLAGAAPEREAEQSDLEKLQGDWKTKSFLLGGGPLPKEKQFPDRLMTIKGDSFSEFRGGKVAVRGTLKLDSSTSPKHLNATFTQGGPTGETVRGIYELDGDTLKVCVGTPDTERPAKFESLSGTKLRLIVYERKRP
ncbi:MAG: TIGR03067 domain-containing protein [Isosphaeraceae bacterium]|nr:TIGR03067 domain-containing protein [Isosphaeraceae bacterium]